MSAIPSLVAIVLLLSLTLVRSAGAGAILYMVSEPGDYIGLGQTRTFDASTDFDFTASRGFDQGAHFRFTNSAHVPIGQAQFWNLDLAGPLNAPLLPGVYTKAQRWPFQTAGHPGLDFAGDGRGSNRLTGQFKVWETHYGLSGEILGFAVDFEQHSEGAFPGLVGQLRYNSTVPIDLTPEFAPKPRGHLHFVSDPGDYIGGGQERTFDESTSFEFLARRNFDNGVNLSFTNNRHVPFQDAEFWSIDFAAPFDVPLGPGIFEDATRWPFQAPGHPGLSLFGDGRGCNQLTGRFEVQKAVYDEGDVTEFAATFEQHCEGAVAALRGEIVFSAAAPAIPLPASAVLVLGGALVLAGLRRRRFSR